MAIPPEPELEVENEEDEKDEDDPVPEHHSESEEDGEDDEKAQVKHFGAQLQTMAEDSASVLHMESLFESIGAWDMRVAVANFTPGSGECTALHLAARAKLSQLCATLLQQGAEIENKEPGTTALMMACLPPYVPPGKTMASRYSLQLETEFTASMLLQQGADVNATDWQGLTAMQLLLKLLTERMRNEKAVWKEQYLVKDAADKAQARERKAMLQAKEQRIATLGRLRRRDARNQQVRESRLTEEELASVRIQSAFRMRQARKRTKKMREDKAATCIQSRWRAHRAQKTEAGILIAEARENYQRQLALKRSEEGLAAPMQRELGKNCLDVARCLLRHGANMRVYDATGNSVLHQAAQLGDQYGPAFIALLLQHDAPLRAVNGEGLTPYDLATSMDHGACAKLLAAALAQEKLPAYIRAKSDGSPSQFFISQLSPFMSLLEQVLYLRPWPNAYKTMLDQDPQRRHELDAVPDLARRTPLARSLARPSPPQSQRSSAPRRHAIFARSPRDTSRNSDARVGVCFLAAAGTVHGHGGHAQAQLRGTLRDP